MKQSEEATRKVGQEYVLNTFDMSFPEEMSDLNISDPVILLQFIQNITKETLGDTIEDESVNVVLQKYLAY